MHRSRRDAKHRGQGTLEMVSLVVAILVVVVGLQYVLRRAVGGRYRGSIDQLSQQQFNPEEPYYYSVRSSGARVDTASQDGSTRSRVGISGLDQNGKKVVTGDEVVRQSIMMDSTDTGEAFVNKEGSLTEPVKPSR